MSNLFSFGHWGVAVALVLCKMEARPNKVIKNAVRVHLKINGRVQGVYFRASTAEQARRLGLTGWVMNCPDSSVEVVAEGQRGELEKLINWCRKGPPGAQVKEVRSEWENSTDEFQGFFVKR